MKKLEKRVHFVEEGTSIAGCYDSKGNPVRYILINGEPHISLDNSVDRLLDIADVLVHNIELDFYANNKQDLFRRVDLTGVINGTFVSSKNSHWLYAERKCSHSELASFHLAMYKIHKTAVRLSETNNG